MRSTAAAASPTLFGHFARFDEWTEIDSVWEGHFMERVAPGAFKKTFSEQRDKMRVLFQHGQDPEIGDKPIAAIQELREDDQGAYYEAQVFDGLPGLVMDGLRAGQYGASFRFSVVKDEMDKEARASDYNPKGLPERTLKEIRVPEFGPVTFGAYDGATAGVRSLTDDFILRCFAQDPQRLREMFTKAHSLRMDVEDMNTIAQMVLLGTEYIDEQDEPDDAANIPVMEGVLQTLNDLMAVEAAETEPDEGEDEADGGRSATKAGAERADALHQGEAGAMPHSDRGSRDKAATSGTDSIFGLARKERESWRL